jgi:hypothetical protein
LLIQGSYTFERSLERIEDSRSPTDWDTPHRANIFASYSLSRAWTAIAVFQSRSGLPLTPATARLLVPDQTLRPFLNSRYLFGERNSSRVATYSRLDLALQREWRARGANWRLGVQALNILAKTNPITYEWRSYFCWLAGECRAPRADRRGLPVLPSIFIGARW